MKNKLHAMRQHQVLPQLLSQNDHCRSSILQTEIVTQLKKQFYEGSLPKVYSESHV